MRNRETKKHQRHNSHLLAIELSTYTNLIIYIYRKLYTSEATYINLIIYIYRKLYTSEDKTYTIKCIHTYGYIHGYIHTCGCRCVYVCMPINKDVYKSLDSLTLMLCLSFSVMRGLTSIITKFKPVKPNKFK